jgi:preprotein translocase subunit SecE
LATPSSARGAALADGGSGDDPVGVTRRNLRTKATEGEVARRNRRGDDEEFADDRLDDEAFDDDLDDDDADDDDVEDEPVSRGGTATRSRAKAESEVSRTRTGAGRVGIFGRIARFFREVVAELRKVIWPTRKELLTYTAVVVVFVALMLTVVTLLDFAFGKGVFWVFGN